MKRLLDYGRTVELLPPLDNGMISRFNPSIIYKDGKFTITVREASYAKYEISLNTMNTQFSLNRKFHNRLYITTCNDVFNDELQWNKVTTKSRQNDMLDKFRGVEDVRLVEWNDELYYSGGRRDWKEIPGTDFKVEEGIITNNATAKERMLPTRNQNDKNYIPIEGQPNTYISELCPVVFIKDNKYVETNNKILTGHRGSTQAIKYKDGYIAITHTCNKSIYSHYFVLFDKDLQITSVSEPFSFDRQPIEFTCGICLAGDKFYISYATMDRRAFVLEVETSVLDKLEFEQFNIEKTREDTRHDDRMHLVLVQYKYFEKTKEIITAVNSFKKHAKFNYEIYLLGDKCPWLDTPVIEGDKEDLTKYPCREQHIHVARDLKNAITIFKNRYDEFCLMSDDFFCINDFTWEDLQVPKYNTRRIDAFGTNKKYWNYAKMKTNQLLMKQHLPMVDFTTHCFAVYEINKLEQIIDEYNLTTPCNDYTFEDIYGNLYWPNAVDVNKYRTRFSKRQHVHIGMIADAKKQGKLFMNFADGVNLDLLPYIDAC